MINFNFKKKFGQNFLINEVMINKIIDTIPVSNKKKVVIEIGCGSGILTSALCKKFDFVLGYEIDLELKELLLNNLKDFSNYKIIFKDFLSSSLEEDLKEYITNNYEIYVVANIPYYITTPIVEKLVLSNIVFNFISLLVQKEAFNRLNSYVKEKDYSALSSLIRDKYDIKKQFLISRNNFYPVPNVDNIVMSLIKKEKRVNVDYEKFVKLVNDSFKYKNKTIKNNLSNYNLESISKVLSKYNLNLNSRANVIPLEVFYEITKVI